MKTKTNKWFTIPLFNNYQVNEYGQIKNIKTQRILKPFKDRDGYSYHTLMLNKKRYWKCISRIVATVFHGEAPSDLHEAAHNDGDPSHNYYKNIRWATKKENHADKKIHGTSINGSNNPKSKLSEGDVINIIKINPSGKQTKQIATQYGVNYCTIRDIITRKTWKEVIIDE